MVANTQWGQCEYWEVWLVGILWMGDDGSSNRKDLKVESTGVIYLITTEPYDRQSLCVNLTFNHKSQRKNEKDIWNEVTIALALAVWLAFVNETSVSMILPEALQQLT